MCVVLPEMLLCVSLPACFVSNSNKQSNKHQQEAEEGGTVPQFW